MIGLSAVGHRREPLGQSVVVIRAVRAGGWTTGAVQLAVEKMESAFVVTSAADPS